MRLWSHQQSHVIPTRKSLARFKTIKKLLKTWVGIKKLTPLYLLKKKKKVLATTITTIIYKIPFKRNCQKLQSLNSMKLQQDKS